MITNAILMSTRNLGFHEEISKIISLMIIIKYYQITLYLFFIFRPNRKSRAPKPSVAELPPPTTAAIMEGANEDDMHEIMSQNMNAGKGSLTINLGANFLKITRLSLNVSLLHKHQCHTLLIAMF